MMRNSPTSVFGRAGAEPADRLWQTDRQPAARLGWLLGLMVLPLLAVAGRVVWLQTAAAERFIAGFERITETLEPVPTRDGRILGADGRVLACDVERFGIVAHYRWLEEPPDPDWLRQQALSRLSPTGRRDPERVAQEERRVLEQREGMWRQLAELTGRPPDELTAARQDIQRRVERIVALVEERRGRDRDAEQPADESLSSPVPLWERSWRLVREALTTAPRRGSRAPVIIREELDHHPLLEDVPLETAARIESQPERFPGLRIRTVMHRVYPAGSLAPHIIGSRTPMTEEELEARRARFPHGDPLDYRPGDRIGQTGIERTYDRQLRGLRGVRRVIRDRQGKTIRTEIVRTPRPGQDVVLTLHLPLQERLEAVLDKALASPLPADGPADTRSPLPAGGSVVVLDVRTGAVVAAVSGPRHDLSALVSGDAEAWRRMTSDPRRPFFHRAVQMTVAPGSVFKALTAVALLESRLIDPDERFVCQGYYGPSADRNRCYIFTHYGVGHYDTNLSDALARSCNVYFFAAADKIGPEPIVTWAERFGFGRPTGIDLPGERGGNLPRPPSMEDGDQKSEVRSQKSEVRNQRSEVGGRRSSIPHSALRTPHSATPWYPGDTLGLGIGQSRLAVTPLQIARMMAAIANNGWLVVPHVARAPASAPLPQRIAGLSDDTLRRVREGLERVVAHPQGTGYKTVRLKDVAIAGKTGTAEVGRTQEDHAWFAGYVPADRPRYAFAVVLEHAGSGSQAAGPVARQLVQAMLDLELLQAAP